MGRWEGIKKKMARDTYAMANQARNFEMGFDQNENDGWEAEVSYDGVIGLEMLEVEDME